MKSTDQRLSEARRQHIEAIVAWRSVMGNAWQTYQMRLATWLENQPIPAPSWGPARRAFTTCGPTSPTSRRGEPVAPFVRLPGVRRPECGPLMIRIQ